MEVSGHIGTAIRLIETNGVRNISGVCDYSKLYADAAEKGLAAKQKLFVITQSYAPML